MPVRYLMAKAGQRSRDTSVGLNYSQVAVDAGIVDVTVLAANVLVTKIVEPYLTLVKI